MAACKIVFLDITMILRCKNFFHRNKGLLIRRVHLKAPAVRESQGQCKSDWGHVITGNYRLQQDIGPSLEKIPASDDIMLGEKTFASGYQSKTRG